MSSVEFAEWQAFERLEGELGPARDDWRAAMIAAVIANVNKDKGRKAFEPGDFIPDWAAAAGVKRQLSRQEVADKTKAFFQRLAARRRGGGGKS